jgi:hypothetical protein
MNSAAAPVQRPPTGVWLLLVVTVLTQLLGAGVSRLQAPVSATLPDAPNVLSARVLSFGQPDLMARAIMLWLHIAESGAGPTARYTQLNSEHLAHWLELALKLDPRFSYPLQAAMRLYAEAGSPARQRRMVEVVSAAYPDDPATRWPWMAHAVFVARHRLRDPLLALRLAELLAATPGDRTRPAWVGQLHQRLLEDLNSSPAAPERLLPPPFEKEDVSSAQGISSQPLRTMPASGAR